MKNWTRQLLAVLFLAAIGPSVAFAQSSPPPNPNYTRFNVKADGDIPTPAANVVYLFFNGTTFRFKNSSAAFTDVGGAGISGLNAGRIPQAGSATLIVDSKMLATVGGSSTGKGVWTLYDDTAATGVSQLWVRSGAAQGSTPEFRVGGAAAADSLGILSASGLTYLKNGDGSAFTNIAAGGYVNGALTFAMGLSGSNDFDFADVTALRWGNTTSFAATKDLGLARSAAGILKITNGSSGYGNLALGTRIEFSGDIGFTRWNSGLIAPVTSGGTFAGLFVEQILGTDGAQQRFNLQANGTSPFLRFGSGGSLQWTDNVAEGPSATIDAGLVRARAGVLRSTNGSSGDGGFQGVNLQGASSTALVAASPTAFVDIPVASGARIGGIIEYCVEADDGTDFQIESGVIQFAAVNKAGTVTTASPTAAGTPLQVLNSGTLTAAFTATAGSGKVTINCDAASSLTETTLRIRFRVHVNSSTTAISVAPL